MSKTMNRLQWGLAAFVGVLAFAQKGLASVPWQMNFPEPVTPTAKELVWFDDMLLWIITAISLFCFVLMAYIAIRFRESKNPVPSKTTHHTGLEVAWTLVPILILLVIAVPSFRLLDNQLIIPDGKRTYNGQVIPAPTLDVKATGFTWYWNYAYNLPNDQVLSFDSLLVEGDDLEAKRKADPYNEYPNLLSVDNELIVPVNETVRVTVTADPEGVIHSWFVPHFGIKIDAIPARINQTWFYAEKTGLYYGGCAELCGKGHSLMPIVVRVVSKSDYEAWLKGAKEEFAEIGDHEKAVIVASKH